MHPIALAVMLALSATEPVDAGTLNVPACTPLPAMKQHLSFAPGESLEYDLDALGAQAGKLYLKVLPAHDGEFPISMDAETNTFFSKIRRFHGGGTSYLDTKTLRPSRYIEDATENEVRKTATARFDAKGRRVALEWAVGSTRGTGELPYVSEGLDVSGAIYLLRQMPLSLNQGFCFDAYGIRRVWRIDGKVEAREHVSLPLGEFDAWHLSGVAYRIDRPGEKRDLHVWISDDERRLPLVVMGVIDLGVVRGTLTAVSRPHEKRQARTQGKESLTW